MEEQKYYTPALEELRIGFEFEIQDKVITDIWRPDKVKYPHQISFLIGNQLESGQIRVPHLTAEQIEAEGWEPLFFDNEFYKTVNESEYGLIFHPNDMKVEIMKIMGEYKNRLYFGSCKCINDLRLICKLLGI